MIETAVKERPILFSGEMVRAILEGRKTQTRRVVKRPKWATGRDIEIDEHGLVGSFHGGIEGFAWFPCPFAERDCKWKPSGADIFYKPGLRLWVRETWRPHWDESDLMCCVQYRADGAMRKPEISDEKTGWKFAQECGNPDTANGNKWRPSIFMPRWASRLTLEITEVRVERLQAITEGDANREGLPAGLPDFHLGASRLNWFKDLWNGINARRGYGWEFNPLVWVVSFRKVVRDAE